MLLVVVAVVLGDRDEVRCCVGEGATPEHGRGRSTAALVAGPRSSGSSTCARCTSGPEELLVAAKIAVDQDDTAADIARAIDAAERRIRARCPIARVIYLEPDIDRGEGT